MHMQRQSPTAIMPMKCQLPDIYPYSAFLFVLSTVFLFRPYPNHFLLSPFSDLLILLSLAEAWPSLRHMEC